MKKALSVLILFALVLTAGVSALADETPAIIVSSAEASAGDEVSVSVSLENNPGIMAFVLGIEYDESALERVSVTHEGLGGSWIIGDNAVWIGSSDTTYDGQIMTLTFRVKDDAAAGDAFVTISCGDGSIANSGEESIGFDVVAGAVTVKGGDTQSGDHSEETAATDAPKATATPAQTTAPQSSAADDTALEQSVLETLTEIANGEEPLSSPSEDPEPPETAELPAPDAEPAEIPVTAETAVATAAESAQPEPSRQTEPVLIVIIALAVVLVGLIVVLLSAAGKKGRH